MASSNQALGPALTRRDEHLHIADLAPAQRGASPTPHTVVRRRAAYAAARGCRSAGRSGPLVRVRKRASTGREATSRFSRNSTSVCRYRTRQREGCSRFGTTMSSSRPLTSQLRRKQQSRLRCYVGDQAGLSLGLRARASPTSLTCGRRVGFSPMQRRRHADLSDRRRGGSPQGRQRRPGLAAANSRKARAGECCRRCAASGLGL